MSEVKVDTISERTPANGVAVDGVTIKDSGITIPSGGTLDVNGTIDLSGATQTGINSTWKHLSTTSNTSDVTQIDFEDIFTSDYNIYKMYMVNVHQQSTGGNIELRLGEPNPSDGFVRYSVQGTRRGEAGSSFEYARIGINTGTESSSDWYRGMFLEMTFWYPYGTDQLTRASFIGFGWDNDANYQMPVTGGFLDRTHQTTTPASCTGFRLSGGSGIQGTPTTKFHLYGLEQS
jgi:hypothetical protein